MARAGERNVTVTGAPSGQVATSDVALTLRRLGDTDNSGSVDQTDQLELNRKLNGIATDRTLRELDLSGDGQNVDQEDKLIMNKILNGIAID